MSTGNRFSTDDRIVFVDAVMGGATLTAAAALVGASERTGTLWWRQSGQMRAKHGQGGGGVDDPAVRDGEPGDWHFTLADRAVIQAGRTWGLSYQAIATSIGHNKSSVWKEVKRNSSSDGLYIASAAHTRAHHRAHRPKVLTLVGNEPLCRLIAVWMDDGWSPKLIASMLEFYFEDDKTMRVSHETIYQALYVQTRGNLRADLAKKLSLKRKKRVPHSKDRKSNSPYTDAFRISQRPAEVADRAVPGHWEGDLIIGSCGTAIGTLIERSTRFTILLHLPNGHSSDEVAAAIIREMHRLPEHLRRSVTWDRGTELAKYSEIQLALKLNLYFCDPHSPWQRGTNENHNRLLRFWFEKGSNLSEHTAADIERVAATLNRRPRPTLNLQTPANMLAKLLKSAA
jgi:transposase, IS30 family